jgi:glycosyltransferase involved in cell wall biosynthesis
MRIDVVFPVLPPTIDGIGDHTALLSRALANSADVRILTAQEEYLPIPGVKVERGFTTDHRRGILRIVGAVKARKPDWVFLQFNQFSYGRWGLNPFLPVAMRRIKESLPGTRIAWMVHEDYMPPTSLKRAVMSMWQRAQFQQLGNVADVIFFSIEPWLEQYRDWFPDARLEHLPVGSNIPRVGVDRSVAREALRIRDNTLVVGYFGTMHGSRLKDPLRRAVERIRGAIPDLVVLNVGPDGPALSSLINGTAIIDAGSLPASDVSLHLEAMDLHATAFMDGVSTRRGSFMAGLQHGVATIANTGIHTGPRLLAQHEQSMMLSPIGDDDAFVSNAVRVASDPQLRARLSAAGRLFHDANYAWPVIADHLYRTLSRHR